MPRISTSILAVVAVVSSASVSRADLETVFNGTIPSQDVAMQAFGTNFPSNPVGPFQFTVSATNTDPTFAPGTEFRAFCADIFQGVSPNVAYNFTVGPISALPAINGDATKAALVSRLYNRFYDVATDANRGGAFQLALWELLYDGPGNLNLASGSISVSSPDSVPAVSIAKNWLADLETASPNDTNKYELLGLFNPTAQDQITVSPNPIPAPAGLVLGLVAIGGFAGRRWRKAKQVN